MKTILKITSKLALGTHVIAGLGLAFMLVVTMTEVIMRAFGKPIVGSYELISFTGGIIIGFAIPYTSWKKGHVFVDSIINTFTPEKRDVINVTTRCLGIGLFIFMGWNFISMGLDLYTTKEVSTTLKLPFYPIAYGIGASCFVQCLVLGADILTIVGGEHE
jgi:TRAP-type C4-dicarboxylate transport system permease small subunit